MLRIGVDLGGTKIELIALDRDGEVRERRRIETPAGDYPGTIEAIGRLVETAEHTLGDKGRVGVATPGARSLASGLIKNANSTWLNGRALKEDQIGRAHV